LSRNGSRKSAKAAGETSKPAPSDPVVGTAGLNFSTPTELVDLPSKGEFYPEGHPAHGLKTIEIKYMTAKEEDILTSQTLLKKGVALERLLESVMVDNSINPRSLLVGDRNALLVAARITGFGSDYDTQINCPHCSAATEYSFDLTETGTKESTIPNGVTMTANGTFVVDLPVTGVSVETKLLTGTDESKITAQQQSKKKHKLQETPLTDQLKAIIVSVNDHTDRSIVNKFVDNMPSRDTRHLRKIYDDITPNIDMTFDFECPSCSTSTDVEVPFTVSFLWPK